MQSRFVSHLEVGCALVAAIGVVAFAAGPDRRPLKLLDLNGQPQTLWQDEQDGPVVVVFTRSDCPISNRYAPEVRRLYETFHPHGVAFYLIFVDPRETPDAIRMHLKEFEYPCPALRDPDHALVSETGATVTPEAVVFNSKRAIAYRGRIDDLYADFGKARSEPGTRDLEDAIAATLDGRPVAAPETKAVGCIIADLK